MICGSRLVLIGFPIMKVFPCTLIALTCVYTAMPARAKFMFADTERVPVERLLANLDRSVRANSNGIIP